MGSHGVMKENQKNNKANVHDKKNLRRVNVVITAQTKYNLEHLAAACGYNGIGQVIDKLTREKMISLKDWQ